MKQKIFIRTSAALLFAALFFGACADDNFIDKNKESDRGAALNFEIQSIQDATPEQTRVAALGLNEADMAPQVLEASNNAGLDICLVETTIPGVNPVQTDEQTRGKVIKTNLPTDFSTLGYRGDQASTISQTPNWFYNKRTKSDGQLYDQIFWSWDNRFARFYAIYPQITSATNNIILSSETHSGNPQIEFTVKPNVIDQQDLMTATTGVVEYANRGEAPKTTLNFRHALTAVHFTMGQNLWAGQIKQIEIRGAINKGTYILSDDPSQSGTWTLGTSTDNFVLSNININTVTSPNSVITDDNGNYTFFMIPQEVTGKGINVYVKFYDGKEINVPLKGKWLQGTTKSYTLTNTTSNWDYKFEVLGQDNTAAYDKTDAGTYRVTSYRQFNGTRIPIAWNVVGYDANDDGNFDMNEKPEWLEGISLTEGVGGYNAQLGRVTVKKAKLIDMLKPYNDIIRKEPPKGTQAAPYNLSNSTGATTIENTGNSYLVSSCGYYKIPLVYGNAITNSADNPASYISSAPSVSFAGNQGYTFPDIVLHKFLDHNNQEIHSPYINVQNAANPATKASIVWADQPGLVEDLNIEGSGSNTFVKFKVSKDNIRSGNAVIAVKNNSGTIMWSWHLWFSHADALDKIPVTNKTNYVYKFSKSTLGLSYLRWEISDYNKPRTVKLKIRQSMKVNGSNKESIITITQNPGGIKDFATALYQFGRKDALPGTDAIAEGNYTFDSSTGGHTLGEAIQNPDKMFQYSQTTPNILAWTKTFYVNLWSTNNIVTSQNDKPVIKTVYDPCPPGFKMPPPNAFTAFRNNQGKPNAEGEWDYGYHYYNKLNSPDATIYFPAVGDRDYAWGGLSSSVGRSTYYLSAIPWSEHAAWAMYLSRDRTDEPGGGYGASAYGIHPIADE